MGIKYGQPLTLADMQSNVAKHTALPAERKGKHMAQAHVKADGSRAYTPPGGHPYGDPSAIEHAANKAAGHTKGLARAGTAKHPSVSAQPPIHDGMVRHKDGQLHAGPAVASLNAYPDASSPNAMDPTTGLHPKCSNNPAGARVLAGAVKNR